MTASPGMTLCLIPARMTLGLIVSRRSAFATRGFIGSQSASTAASARRGSGPVRASITRAIDGAAVRTAAKKRSITGVRRGGPGSAIRSTIAGRPDRGVVVPRHRAVAPGPVDGEPVVDEALLRDPDRVEPHAGELGRDAASSR